MTTTPTCGRGKLWLLGAAASMIAMIAATGAGAAESGERGAGEAEAVQALRQVAGT